MFNTFSTLVVYSTIYYACILLTSWCKAKILDGPDGIDICADYLRENMIKIFYGLVVFVLSFSYFASEINKLAFDKPWWNPHTWLIIFSFVLGLCSCLFVFCYTMENVFISKKSMHKKTQIALEKGMLWADQDNE